MSENFPSSPGTEGLLPCPFCGTADPLLIDGTENEVGYFVRCEYCRLDYPQPLMNSAEKAIAIWNTRFPSPGTKLLPCPFCGGAMEEVTDEDGHYFVHPGRVGMQRADCWLCDAWVSDEESGEGSIGEWNARLGITSVAQRQPDPLKEPQYIIEGIILRRLHEKRIEGYTIETAKEIAEALSLSSTPSATPCVHNVIIGLDGCWHCQTCGADVDMAVAQTSTNDGSAP